MSVTPASIAVWMVAMLSSPAGPWKVERLRQAMATGGAEIDDDRAWT
jgi:hypothetical protein